MKLGTNDVTFMLGTSIVDSMYAGITQVFSGPTALKIVFDSWPVDLEFTCDGAGTLDIGDGPVAFSAGAVVISDIPDSVDMTLVSTEITYISFEDAGYIKTVNIVDGSSLTSLENSFRNCGNLVTFSAFNTYNVTSLANTFRDSIDLATVSALDTSSVTDATYSFTGCEELVNMCQIDYSKILDASFMYYNSGITHLGDINTAACETFTYMFNECTDLVCLSSMDTTSDTLHDRIFENCTSLSQPDAQAQSDLRNNNVIWTNAGTCP